LRTGRVDEGPIEVEHVECSGRACGRRRLHGRGGGCGGGNGGGARGGALARAAQPRARQHALQAAGARVGAGLRQRRRRAGRKRHHRLPRKHGPIIRAHAAKAQNGIEVEPARDEMQETQQALAQMQAPALRCSSSALVARRRLRFFEVERQQRTQLEGAQPAREWFV
jgi:hypothetical protein